MVDNTEKFPVHMLETYDFPALPIIMVKTFKANFNFIMQCF